MRISAGLLALMMLALPEAGIAAPIQSSVATVEPVTNVMEVAERRQVRRPAGRPNAGRLNRPAVRQGRPAVRQGRAAVRPGRPAVRRNTVIRNNTVVRNRTVVVRPVRPWIRRPYYGRVVAGVALGTVIAVSAIPRASSSDLCWYWSNSSQTRGYWDYCVPR